MVIEKSKIYRTRLGQMVEIYSIGLDYIFGAICREHGWNSITWEIDGKHASNSDLDIVELWDKSGIISTNIIKCECGSDVLKSDRHSKYCPKFNANY